jgi:hypothetical protein
MMGKESKQTLRHGKVFALNREKIILTNGRNMIAEVIRHLDLLLSFF